MGFESLAKAFSISLIMWLFTWLTYFIINPVMFSVPPLDVIVIFCAQTGLTIESFASFVLIIGTFLSFIVVMPLAVILMRD